MSAPIQAIRGMNDVLPEESIYWQHVENTAREVLQSYVYQEIRLPIVEKTELFKRSIGEATDIVEKEMYTFLDRNEESVTLRPELTAAFVRACLEHGLLHNQIQRLWYMGPCFRYEKPQKGRNRQFFQCEADIFGLSGPDVDAELILLSARILDRLQLTPYVRLQLNSLGSADSRKHYRETLVQYFKKHHDQLDEDSQRRLTTNPLRILDSKNPDMATLIREAPKLTDYLDPDSQNHFKKLCDYLEAINLPYEINPCLVRGLDYYTKTVFEWVTTELGAQGTICAGGRFDGLVEQLGGKPTPAIGFAMGLDRTVLLVQKTRPAGLMPPLHCYFITDSEDTFKKGLQLSERLRSQFPSLHLMLHTGGGGFKNQLKKADKSGAQHALILGEREHQEGTITLKSLRKEDPQQTFPQAELVQRIRSLLS